MALPLTIALIVVLVLVRLLVPPVPGLLKMSNDRFGKRSTIILCAVALAGAVVLIIVSRH